MLFYYIDESGTGYKDKQSDFFLLSGVEVHSSKSLAVDRRIHEFKGRLFPWAKPEDFELKGRDIRHGEGLFQALNWSERVSIMNEFADLILALPCSLYAVRVNKMQLSNLLESEEQLYRLAFWRLLDQISMNLSEKEALLLIDSRSTLHSSLQDRRLIDSFREWRKQRKSRHFVELPWFGFSNFYAGLQLADFCAYMIDFASNTDVANKTRAKSVLEAYRIFESKVHLLTIP